VTVALWYKSHTHSIANMTHPLEAYKLTNKATHTYMQAWLFACSEV